MPTKPTLLLTGLILAASSSAEAGWNEGIAAFEAGRYDAAVTEFAAVVHQDPQRPDGHYMLGLSYLILEKYDDAADHLQASGECAGPAL